MNEIRIALTNLGKYNEGELVFTWLELPASEDEINEAMDEIGVEPGGEYEEYFITDFEAPFDIEEYASIDRLNDLAETLSDIPEPTVTRFGSMTMKQYNVDDVIIFAQKHGKEDYVEHIISDEQLNEMVRSMTENGDDWTRIRCFLHDADHQAAWHAINGYANIERLTDDDVERILLDIVRELKNEV